jgi:hypothetical protein
LTALGVGRHDEQARGIESTAAGCIQLCINLRRVQGPINFRVFIIRGKGYVLDSACAFTKNLKKPISAECAVACAKAGSPLVILADGGTIYWPVSDATPARGQNERLMEYAGKRVSVTGKVYQRGGSRAVVIATIAAVN